MAPGHEALTAYGLM